jgi:hypothetical protein
LSAVFRLYKGQQLLRAPQAKELMSLLKALHLTAPPGALPAAPAAAAPNQASAPHAKAAALNGAGPAARNDHHHAASAAKGATLDVNNYVALINGISHLVMNWKHPGSLDVSPSEEKDLSPQHRKLLLSLRSALIMIKTAPVDALALWEQFSPALKAEVERAVPAGLASDEIANCREQLSYAGTLFVGGATYAAEHEARNNSDLEAPDAAQMADKLAKVEGELVEANELFEQSLKIAEKTGKMAGTDAPKDVKEILELVMLPGTIQEKLKHAKEKGLATTAVDLVGKVTGATGTLIRNVGEVGAKVAEARKAILLTRAATAATEESIKDLEKVIGKFEKLAKGGKSLIKGASYAAVIVDGFNLVSALRDGDYSGAAKAGGELLVDGAPLVFGEELAGPLMVVAVTVKAELEVFRLAAAFIGYCKDETVRQAAASFVKQCDVIANGGAYALVADFAILTDASKASLHANVLEKANREAANVSKGIRALSSHVTSSDRHAIGGYPNVVKALGRPAIQAMTVVFTEKDGIPLVAQQIADVFHGANAMAKYVKENYTR